MRTLYPYPIPGEEGDGGSLITGSAMGDLNRQVCGFFMGIPRSEWKSKDDFLLGDVLARLVGS